MGRPKKYTSNEERKAARDEYLREYRETHKSEQAEYMRKWHQANKAEESERMRKYRETPMGRASYLLSHYRQMDIKNGFGDCIDFDAQWIVDYIFTQKCAHCDCTDWKQLGCNRKDNDLPHIKSNVECCCKLHNNELGLEEFGHSPIPIAQYDKNSGELVAVWESAYEASKVLGYGASSINKCCNGMYKQAYGYVWRKLSQEQYEHLFSYLKQNSLI